MRIFPDGPAPPQVRRQTMASARAWLPRRVLPLVLLSLALGVMGIALLFRSDGEGVVEGAIAPRPVWAGRYFPVGVFEDGHLLRGDPARFERMIADLQSRGFDTVLFANTLLERDARLLEVSDRLGFNVFFAASDLRNTWWDESVPVDEATAQRAIQPLVEQLDGHHSLRGYVTADEPGLHLSEKLQLATRTFQALDPRRPAMPVLIGTDRVGPLFSAAQPWVLLIDVYPVGFHNRAGDFTMTGFGYRNLDFVRYVRLVSEGKPPDVPLWIVLQTHSFRRELREPIPSEVRAQHWLAIGEGATGIFWFVYSSQQGWRGLVDNPPLYEEVTTLARRIGPLRNLLLSLRKTDDRFVASGGGNPYTSTLTSRDGQTLYVVAVNRDVLRPQALAIRAADPTVTGFLKDLETSRLYELGSPIGFPPGDGKIFQLVDGLAVDGAERSGAGVPDVGPDTSRSVREWWAAHPLNPENPDAVPIGGIVSPRPIVDARQQYDGDVQAAIDDLPPEGGTVYLAPGTYGPFSIVGRSNVHVVSNGGAVVHGYVRVYGCQLATDYRAFAPAVAARGADALHCATSGRARNIYFRNLIFDGGNTLAAAGTLGAVDGVVFDNVVFRNYGGDESGAMDEWLVDHGGLINGAEMLDNVWFRGVHFGGGTPWVLYLDGCHGCGVVHSRVDQGFRSGAFLFMTNDDFTNDVDGDGVWEPDELRQTSYLVLAHNVVGTPGDTTTLPLVAAVTGRDVLVARNVVQGPVDHFVLFNGKCSARWTNVRYRYERLHVIGNQVASATTLVHLDGTPYNCNGRSMPVGQYEVLENSVADGGRLQRLVRETGSVVGPNVVAENEVAGHPAP